MNLYSILLSVASIWVLAVMTPGPNFFITAQTTVKHSRFAGLFIVLGTCTGTLIWSVAGYFGIACLFITAPWLYATLKIAGGSYIVYLGIMMIMNSKNTVSHPEAPCSRVQNHYTNWLKGLVTNLANPKTAMFVTSLFASVLPKDPPMGAGLLIISSMVVISFVWYSFVVFLFSSNRFTSGYNKMQRWLERVAGAIFIGFGAKLIFTDK
ncbi:MAG: lysine transporter LysE [Desulfobacteraceae bacterium]|nr:MAG: lysine transporter LysE [Desulfobacteraceae bacterium]